MMDIIVVTIFLIWLAITISVAGTIISKRAVGEIATVRGYSQILNSLCLVGPFICCFSFLGWILLPLFALIGAGIRFLGSSYISRGAGNSLMIGAALGVGFVLIFVRFSAHW